MPIVRIAQAQINPTVGHFSGNTAKIIDAIHRGREQQADIITFPELAVCGYPPDDLLLKRGFIQDSSIALEKVRGCSDRITAVVGHVEQIEGRVYNSTSVFQDRKRLAVHHKIELPGYGVFDEKRYFTPGRQPVVFGAKGLRFFLTIGEDFCTEEGPVGQALQTYRPDIIINISAAPFHAGRLDLRLNAAARFARRGDAFFCLNNLVGGQDELVFDGGSFIMNNKGEIVAQAPRFREWLQVTEIEIRSRNDPQEMGSGSHRILSAAPNADPNGPPTPPPSPDHDDLDEIYQTLILGTRDYVQKNGFEKAVIGLSGGIDSALVAAIAVDALGPENVIGVTMPSPYTSEGTLTDAGRLSENLNIRLIRLPIQSIYQAYLDLTDGVMDHACPGITHENIQARIRGNLLMALSNQFGWLALTGGNKSEGAVGYCTLYGDMAGGFAVIKDVPKTLVFELSAHVNRASGREIIPASVIARPPSAELRPNQKDEDSLPPYPVLDRILKAYVEGGSSPEEITAQGFDPEMVRDVIRRVNLNEYKRRQGPPGVRITPGTPDRGRWLPITNAHLRGSG